jgi:metallo-beta-lactamase family protein
MAEISFFGAAGEVTGSNFLIAAGNAKYLVDCGLFQGSSHAFDANMAGFKFDPAEIKAVAVTHAHLDHIGRLPKLVKDGYRGPIYATEATLELTELVLKDAYHVMQSRARHDQMQRNEGLMYEEEDLKRTLALFKPIPYHKAQPLEGDDSVTLYDAGHVLGSASVLLQAGGKKFVFSGDLGHYPNTLLPHSEPPPVADVIVTEGTYGGVEHEPKQDRTIVLKEAIEWTIQNRGVLLIPAFSIERTQELLYLFHQMFAHQKLPRIPIYVDGPLAIEALEVFDRHMELYSEQVKKDSQSGHEIFSFKSLALTPTVPESKAINEIPPPKVIIAGSGMMVGGRIIHHLKRYLPHRQTMLMVVGYQAEGTLGRDIVNGAKHIRVDRADIPVNAKVQTVDAFSGHADNSELLDWLKGIKLAQGGRVFVVHSDPKRAESFMKNIETTFPGVAVEAAQVGQSVQV